MSSTSPRPPVGVDPLLSTLLIAGLLLFAWPAALLGLLLWRLLAGRAWWLWLPVLVLGVGLAWVFWLHDPLGQLQTLTLALDIHHLQRSLMQAFPWWTTTTLLGPLLAGAIELFRPRTAQERLLQEQAKHEAQHRRASQRARRAMRKVPDTIKGDGVLGRIIE